MKLIRKIKNIITLVIILFIGYVGYLMVTGKDTSIVDDLANIAMSSKASELLSEVFPDIPETELETVISGVTITNNSDISSLSYDVKSICPSDFTIDELASFNVDVKVKYTQKDTICQMDIIYTK